MTTKICVSVLTTYVLKLAILFPCAAALSAYRDVMQFTDEGRVPAESDVTNVRPEDELIVAGSGARQRWPNRGVRTQEQRLLYHLLDGYERAVRPVRNATTPIVVKVGLTLTNIVDMDEKNQVLSTNAWLEQEWRDELLEWNPADFDGIENIRIPCDSIWLPDIVLYNNADDYTRGYMRVRALVHYDGTVFWAPATQLRSACKVDITYFPFDSQRCLMKFGSWTYHSLDLDIWNRTGNVDLSNYIVSGEFDLLHVHQMRRVVSYTCCSERYPDITFFIHIRRKTLYYVLNVLLPCMTLSCLTLLVFLVPPDGGEKVALGIAVLLSFSVFVLTMAEKMPETSDSLPLIGAYFTSVMTITSLSIVMTVMILNVRESGIHHQPVPVWVKKLVLDKLRRLLRMRLHEKRPKTAQASLRTAVLRQLALFIPTKAQTTTTVIMDENGNQNQNGLVPRAPSSESRPAVHGFADRGQQVIYEALRTLLARQNLDEEFRAMSDEWRQVARVIDRFLFWIFLTVTASTTGVLLVVIPVYDRIFHTVEFDEKLYGVVPTDGT